MINVHSDSQLQQYQAENHHHHHQNLNLNPSEGQAQQMTYTMWRVLLTSLMVDGFAVVVCEVV